MGYVELHCHSCYSLKDGASTPLELVQQAKALGMNALALTDHNAVYGAVEFCKAATEVGIKPIFGAEMTLDSGHHLTLLVKNLRGWSNLGHLITLAQFNAPKGEALIALDAFFGHTDGLIALTGCKQGLLAEALLRKDRVAAKSALKDLIALFGRDNLWVELQRHHLPGEKSLIQQLVALAKSEQVGIVATNNVHYATPERKPLQDVLVCVEHLTNLDDAQARGLLRINHEYHLKSGQQMGDLFGDYPESIINTQIIANQCNFIPEYGYQDLPEFPTPNRVPAETWLRQLCESALTKRFSGETSKVRAQLEHELGVIRESGLSNYFLIVWDIVNYARSQNILCQGRGSAANSLVAYLLHITPIDPIEHGLVFERFLSKERQVTPDIDIDFDSARREEVIQYVMQRYGTDHAAMTCTFVTYRTKSALRDVGRALGVPPEWIERASKAVRGYRGANRKPLSFIDETVEEPLDDSVVEQIYALVEQLQGLPRHIGQHNGGMVIMRDILSQRVPIEPATMQDRVVIQWDKEALETVNLVKFDILGLGMLAAIQEASETVLRLTGKPFRIEDLTFDDPAIFRMIAEADTIGLFQVESRAQAQLLPRFQPKNFSDIIIAISLIRPGPIQGGMVHPLLRRRTGREEVTYLHDALRPSLEETYGVIVWQEQVLLVARDIAGFTPGEGEQLRRALGAKNGYERVESFHDRFIMGAASKGISADIAEAIFDQLRGFGGYSFAKSHAASFAVLVYASAYLRKYHPAAFYCALINVQPMGFWSVDVLTNDARRLGVKTLKVNINHSAARTEVLDAKNIRLGLMQVKSIGESSAERILAAREKGNFTSLEDLCRRTRLPERKIENLIQAGAVDAWGIPRRKLIWQAGLYKADEDELDLAYLAEELALPLQHGVQEQAMEYSVTGINTGDHLMSYARDSLRQRGILASYELADCAHNSIVRVAGQNRVAQSPQTAKGMTFLTLEDEWGMMNIVVRHDIFGGYARIILDSPLLLVKGLLERGDGGTINVVAHQFAALPKRYMAVHLTF